jgi:hypothetical protein
MLVMKSKDQYGPKKIVLTQTNADGSSSSQLFIYTELRGAFQLDINRHIYAPRSTALSFKVINNLCHDLAIHNIRSDSADLTIHTPTPIELRPGRPSQLIRASFTRNTQHSSMAYYLYLQVSDFLFYPLPLVLYDRTLECAIDNSSFSKCSLLPLQQLKGLELNRESVFSLRLRNYNPV